MLSCTTPTHRCPKVRRAELVTHRCAYEYSSGAPVRLRSADDKEADCFRCFAGLMSRVRDVFIQDNDVHSSVRGPSLRVLNVWL